MGNRSVFYYIITSDKRWVFIKELNDNLCCSFNCFYLRQMNVAKLKEKISASTLEV